MGIALVMRIVFACSSIVQRWSTTRDITCNEEGFGLRQVGTNPPCCGDVYHFDLSYWAFQNVRPPSAPTQCELQPPSC